MSGQWYVRFMRCFRSVQAKEFVVMAFDARLEGNHRFSDQCFVSAYNIEKQFRQEEKANA